MKIYKLALLSLLTASLVQTTSAHAMIAPAAQSSYLSKAISIYINGKQLVTAVAPISVQGSTLVPMRSIFEEQGAKLTWNGISQTITANKGNLNLTYRVGDQTANVNGQTLKLSVPAQVINGYTLIPLRFISEALGSTVKWDQATYTVYITYPLPPDVPAAPSPVPIAIAPSVPTSPVEPPKPAVTYETSIVKDVNLRSVPDSKTNATSLGMLHTHEQVHVIREVNALWLEVQLKNGRTGYISAKPSYTNYISATLADMQGDAIIAEGKKYLGTPYLFGSSSDQTKTFDCSSFVKRVYQDTLSISLPRLSYDQAKSGKEIAINELRKGDLLFFSARGLDIGHVAIYMGNNQILHTYSKEQGVHVEAFDGQWKKRFVAARRVFQY